MKIWFDILTPKQVLFFEPMIKKLKKKHRIICTSRQYREVTHLAKIRKIHLRLVGKHGGDDKYGKLTASVSRMSNLLKIIKKFSPVLTISFCSPEAARISFGLGIKHIAFCDSPHAEAVMRLTLPLIDRLLIPWIIPKKEFSKYGIVEKRIIPYKAIDAGIIIRSTSRTRTSSHLKIPKKKTLLVRPYESHASYVNDNKNQIFSIIQNISKGFPDCNIMFLGRYQQQIKELKNKFGKKILIVDNVIDSKEILSSTDVFIGSGGTMTAEAALRGIPTISYNAVPNLIESYLVKKGLVKREENPKKMVPLISKLLQLNKIETKKIATKETQKMEDPYNKLLETIQSITE